MEWTGATVTLNVSDAIGVYRYRAARPGGQLESGRVDAASAEQVTRLLTSRGLFPITVQLDRPRREQRPALPLAELALGLRVMADLLEAGLPMTRTLHAFEELAPASWRTAVPHLRQSVKEGNSLAMALATAPVEIPALVIGIARAGEAGQGIGSAIRRAAELTETAAATRAAVRAALIYPVVLAAAGVASVGILLGVVLPRFARILAELGQELPPATRMVMSLSTAARDGFLPAILTLVVGLAIWRAWTANEHGRRSWHAWLLTLPLVGEVRRAAATARSSWALAALLDSGVPIADALRFAAQSAGDSAVQHRMLAARDQISAGASIGRAFEETRAVTPTAVRLIRAGEESGRLAGLLAHAARIEQERSERIVRSAVRALEPALILCFASIVALVAAALLQAVYSVRPGA